MTENNIVWEDETGFYYVYRTRDCYSVQAPESPWVSRADSCFDKSSDGLSLAVARAKYKAKIRREITWHYTSTKSAKI
jgi:hypothetical protein